MTADELIAEGRKLSRPCVFLRPSGAGQIAGVWHAERQLPRGARQRLWLAVNAKFIPTFAPILNGYISVFTNERGEDGTVGISGAWGQTNGTPLYAQVASVLPPIDAVFARGSIAVEKWLASRGWSRDEPYNGNFKDQAADAYNELWMREHPLYNDSDVYAILGGWHFPFPDDDWPELIDEQLMIFTLKGSEPWVEVWRTRTGEYRVVQRIT